MCASQVRHIELNKIFLRMLCWCSRFCVNKHYCALKALRRRTPISGCLFAHAYDILQPPYDFTPARGIFQGRLRLNRKVIDFTHEDCYQTHRGIYYVPCATFCFCIRYRLLAISSVLHTFPHGFIFLAVSFCFSVVLISSLCYPRFL